MEVTLVQNASSWTWRPVSLHGIVHNVYLKHCTESHRYLLAKHYHPVVLHIFRNCTLCAIENVLTNAADSTQDVCCRIGVLARPEQFVCAPLKGLPRVNTLVTLG